MSAYLKRQYDSSPLHGANAPYIEDLYEHFLDDPGGVPDAWRRYFEGLTNGGAAEIAHRPVQSAIAHRLRQRRAAGRVDAAAQGDSPTTEKQAAVARLIQVYGMRGHQIADLDPLGLWQRHVPAVLKLDYLGLSEADMETEFFVGGLSCLDRKHATLREILATLKRVYCGKVGAEFAHLSRARERFWLRERFETMMFSPTLTAIDQRAIFSSLTHAEGIERYLNTKYVGQKRFSLEGGESLIPMLDDAIQRAGEQRIQEIVIGMAHRGRLNVLINVLGKSPQELFTEFEGAYDVATLTGSGDVKYHMGFSADIRTPGGNIHVALAFNPSHLEIVDPVVEGSVRARQDRRGDDRGELVVPILVHGDAAMAGQGVVAETLQLSQTRHFSTGGTIHVVVNNQVGFTTSNVEDSRSTPYCSDIAKMVEAPVLHVNGDEPESAVAAMRLALEYRRKFHKDVVIDLVCYRRLGHNEADEPAATQPLMYQTIRRHPTTRTIYAQRLVTSGLLSDEAIADEAQAYRDCLDAGRSPNAACLGMIGNQFTADWSRFAAGLTEPVDTSVPSAELARLAAVVTRIPEDFKLHPRVQRVLDDRRRMAQGELDVDWGFAETLAYASLLSEGFHVRLIGQDSRRGTFFHRHATYFNQRDGRSITPLEAVARPAAATIGDSLLSEEAVLGFEYGYSTTSPDCLVIWEAQFGDFANGAQVVIDQFISSGEAKWGRLSGLTLLLPHGYEGQGPEHSSARLERFLQLCAEHNIQVCVPSTPAQMFHLLRRQMVRPLRKPLIVMTPKSLLRHRSAVSTLDELSSSGFQPLLGETEQLDRDGVRRLIFCSGKVYYELALSRMENHLADVAIVRLEELYPFPVAAYAETVRSFANVRTIVWCQEEPENQGAWYQIRHRLQEPLSDDVELLYAGRHGAAAPASGIHKLHVAQQDALVHAALGLNPAEARP